MTTKNENNVAPYLLDPNDPHYKKPSKKRSIDDLETIDPIIKVKPKRTKVKHFNPFKEYFNCILEVILK